MPRCPERQKKKLSINLTFDDALHQDIERLAQEYGRSVSSTVETIALLLKAEYEQTGNERVARLLLKAKIRFLSSLDPSTAASSQSTRHLTLDEEALQFAETLATKYPAVFASRKEVILLCLRHVQQLCQTNMQRNYLVRRLHDVRQLSRAKIQ